MSSEDTNDQLEVLLDRAESMIMTSGASRVKMDDIASDMKMSKKTIYKLVPGKDSDVNIITEIINEIFVSRSVYC